MRAWIKSLTLAAAGIALFLPGSIVRAEFVGVSQNLSMDSSDRQADSTPTFNQPPDFSTVNPSAGPADSSQIDCAGTSATPDLDCPKNLTSISRGDEIHFADALRVRSASGVGGFDAGGPVIDMVPFALAGDSGTFSVPAKDHSRSNHGYQCRAFTAQFGRLSTQEAAPVVPMPTALQSGVGGLVVLAGLVMYVRHRSQSQVD